MGVEHLQVSRKKPPISLRSFRCSAISGNIAKAKPRLHPPEVEGNLNGQ